MDVGQPKVRLVESVKVCVCLALLTLKSMTAAKTFGVAISLAASFKGCSGLVALARLKEATNPPLQQFHVTRPRLAVLFQNLGTYVTSPSKPSLKLPT